MASLSSLSPSEVFCQIQRELDDPEIFFLKRNDTAAQAVSHYFMVETGIANSNQSGSDKPDTYMNLKYDPQAILKFYDFTRGAYEFWNIIFTQNSVSVRNIIYENLMENTYETISEMTHHINKKIQLSPAQVAKASKTGIRKLSIIKKKEFTENFRNYLIIHHKNNQSNFHGRWKNKLSKLTRTLKEKLSKFTT